MISDEPRIGQSAVLALDDQLAASVIPRITASPFRHLRMASSPFRVHTRLLRSLGIEVDHRVRLQLNGQIGAVLSLVNGQIPMFYLELVTGLRKGEITALLWSDLDTQNKTISVSKQYVKNPNGELTLSRPKTETSVRKVSIPQEAVDLLVAEHKKHPDNPYMFPSPATGEMYYPDSIVNLHKKILKDAGLPHIRFHDLRHAFATLALQNGVDVKTVSSMLGHYNAGFTLRTYTHATRQKQDEAAQTMGSFMAQVM